MQFTKYNAIGTLLAAIGISGEIPPALATMQPARPSKKRAAGMYGRGLMRHFNKARREAEVKRQKVAFAPRDAHGAVTLTGRHWPDGVRRVWKAGISAQRGY